MMSTNFSMQILTCGSVNLKAALPIEKVQVTSQILVLFLFLFFLLYAMNTMQFMGFEKAGIEKEF